MIYFKLKCFVFDSRCSVRGLGPIPGSPARPPTSSGNAHGPRRVQSFDLGPDEPVVGIFEKPSFGKHDEAIALRKQGRRDTKLQLVGASTSEGLSVQEVVDAHRSATVSAKVSVEEEEDSDGVVHTKLVEAAAPQKTGSESSGEEDSLH